MSRSRQSISATSRMTRALLQIVDKPTITSEELDRVVGSVCETNGQMRGLIGAMRERGFTERVSVIHVTDEARSVIARLKARK